MNISRIFPFLALGAAVAAGVLLFFGCRDGHRTSGKDGKEAVLSFHSFDGGGPEYKISVADPDVVSFRYDKTYKNPNHEELEGASFTVSYTLTGLKQGSTTVTVKEFSPIGENREHIYLVTVAEDLSVTAAKQPEPTEEQTVPEPVCQMIAAIGDKVYYATAEENPTAKAFIEKLSTAELQLELRDDGGAEATGTLPWSLPENAEENAAQAGDLVLVGDDTLALCKEAHTAVFTRIARIDGFSGEDLTRALRDGTLTVTLWAEWSE